MTAPALAVTRGDTLTWRFTITSDITGWTPRWVAKPVSGWADIADASATISATTGTGLVSTPGATSYVDLTITATVTAALTPGVYVWDLQLTSGAAVRTVEWDAAGTTVGSLIVSPDVTRVTP
jgi:hypothetical protein